MGRIAVGAALWRNADTVLGSADAWLIIDDTAMPKKGKAWFGIAPQYALSLGRNVNCQTPVPTTLGCRHSKAPESVRHCHDRNSSCNIPK